MSVVSLEGKHFIIKGRTLTVFGRKAQAERKGWLGVFEATPTLAKIQRALEAQSGVALVLSPRALLALWREGAITATHFCVLTENANEIRLEKPPQALGRAVAVIVRQVLETRGAEFEFRDTIPPPSRYGRFFVVSTDD